MIRRRAREAVRRLWMRYVLRGVTRADAHRRLDLAYKVEDPWHMDAAREQFRFAETNRIIESEIAARFGRLLEIGCGEGHQTTYLSRLADDVTGIDVSPAAVSRARTRATAARFIAGDLLAQPWANEQGRFDLVTACEVLYYIRDIAGFLRAIDRLGGTCLVTYFEPARHVCEELVMKMPGARQERFRFDDTVWIAAWWTGAAKRS